MNLQTKNNQKGFTIVELLIVIVVIGILAAITIVAYNGIQKRANASAAQSAANTLQKKAEAYNSLQSGYPASLANFNAEKESELSGSGISLGVRTATTGATTISASNGKTTLQYERCGTSGTGARISYWDYNASTPAVPATAQVMLGDATSASTCTVITS